MYDYERLEQYAEKISTKIGFQPKVGLVLGTGLGDMAEKIETVYEVPFTSLNGFPVSTVEGHVGHFLFGYMEDVPIVCMQGRVHYYEGYSMEDVVLPIRFMATMGVESIILTNAAGGINKDFNVGDIMVITDHISSFVPNPLIGKNVDHFGVRFPDMSNIYDKQMREIFVNVAKQNGADLFIGATAWAKGAGANSADRMAVYCNKERYVAVDELVPLTRAMTTPNAERFSYDTAYAANVSEVELFYNQTMIYVDGI